MSDAASHEGRAAIHQNMRHLLPGGVENALPVKAKAPLGGRRPGLPGLYRGPPAAAAGGAAGEAASLLPIPQGAAAHFTPSAAAPMGAGAGFTTEWPERAPRQAEPAAPSPFFPEIKVFAPPRPPLAATLQPQQLYPSSPALVAGAAAPAALAHQPSHAAMNIASPDAATVPSAPMEHLAQPAQTPAAASGAARPAAAPTPAEQACNTRILKFMEARRLLAQTKAALPLDAAFPAAPAPRRGGSQAAPSPYVQMFEARARRPAEAAAATAALPAATPAAAPPPQPPSEYHPPTPSAKLLLSFTPGNALRGRAGAKPTLPSAQAPTGAMPAGALSFLSPRLRAIGRGAGSACTASSASAPPSAAPQLALAALAPPRAAPRPASQPPPHPHCPAPSTAAAPAAAPQRSASSSASAAHPRHPPPRTRALHRPSTLLFRLAQQQARALALTQQHATAPTPSGYVLQPNPRLQAEQCSRDSAALLAWARHALSPSSALLSAAAGAVGAAAPTGTPAASALDLHQQLRAFAAALSARQAAQAQALHDSPEFTAVRGRIERSVGAGKVALPPGVLPHRDSGLQHSVRCMLSWYAAPWLLLGLRTVLGLGGGGGAGAGGGAGLK